MSHFSKWQMKWSQLGYIHSIVLPLFIIVRNNLYI